MLHPIDRFEWEKCIRLVVMPTTTKLVALALATYGNRQGSNIHPGNKRLARELCMSPRTVERSIEWLRSRGLLEQTFQGRSAGRKGLANAYRLVVAEDLPDRVQFVQTDDTHDGSSTPETPDTDDVSSSGSDDTDDVCSAPITRHDGPEQPSPAAGTPDRIDVSPVTGVDPSWKYQQDHTSSSDSSSADSISACADELDADLAIIKALPASTQERLWNDLLESNDALDWPALVHLAAERVTSGAVA